jgi:hypothetical protein
MGPLKLRNLLGILVASGYFFGTCLDWHKAIFRIFLGLLSNIEIEACEFQAPGCARTIWSISIWQLLGRSSALPYRDVVISMAKAHTHTKHGSGNLSWQCKMLMIYHLLEMGISCCQDMKIAAYGISYTVSLFYPLNTDLFPWKYPSLEFYLWLNITMGWGFSQRPGLSLPKQRRRPDRVGDRLMRQRMECPRLRVAWWILTGPKMDKIMTDPIWGP